MLCSWRLLLVGFFVRLVLLADLRNRFNDGNLTLKVRHRSGRGPRNTQIQWKIINGTEAHLREVRIANKEYRCSNGKKVIRSGEQIASSLPVDEEATSYYDNLNNRGCPRITEIRMTGDSDLFVTFRIREEKRRGWGRNGRVRVVTD